MSENSLLKHLFYDIFLSFLLPTSIIILGIKTYYISFLFHNIFTCLFLFLAFKIENQKKKILLILLFCFLLIIYYFNEKSNNIASALLYYAAKNLSKNKQIIFFVFALFLIFYTNIRTFIYQNIYGEKTFIQISEKNPDYSFQKHLSNDEIEVTKNSFEVTFIPIIDTEFEARVVYIDEYDKKFAFDDYYSHPLYDTFAPLDATLFVRSMADNWKNFRIKHERRGAFVGCYNKEACALYNPKEWTNAHIIPNNQNIRKGFKTIQKGDVIKIKGFLVDWQGKGKYDYFKIKTARHFADDSEEKAGGRPTLLCMQIYVLELIANNYVYK